ncbi:hypothetical protein D3C78_1759320 [compost metagenome]
MQQDTNAAVLAGGGQRNPLGEIRAGGVELAAIEHQLAVGAALHAGLEGELVLAADFRQGVAETLAGEHIGDHPRAHVLRVTRGQQAAQHHVVDLQQLADAAVGH